MEISIKLRNYASGNYQENNYKSVLKTVDFSRGTNYKRNIIQACHLVNQCRYVFNKKKKKWYTLNI